MAPRNRRRKVGLKRIDAALAAMRPLGFTDNAVRKSVKELLRHMLCDTAIRRIRNIENHVIHQVYGDEGWFFMEEAAYKLLIETILEGQEQATHENLLKEGNGGKGDNANGIAVKPEPTEDLCDKDVCKEQKCVKDLQREIFSNEVGDLENNEEKCVVVNSRDSSKDDIEQAQFRSQLDFAPMYSAMVVDHVPTILRQKPCYGWITDGEDDDDDFLLLPPAKVC